jgi:RNA polymerase sigma-70 factor (ECF subfamily)
MTRQPSHDQPQHPPDPSGLSQTLYGELRRIAERLFMSERRDHTLQPTAVVNEAWMRLAAGGLPQVPHDERLALAARVLKQVLIDHARAWGAAKRGGGALRVGLDEQVLDPAATTVDFQSIHAALARLGALNPRQAEVVTLRIFAGMTMDQVATVLGTSKRTAEGDWAIARAWLRRELASAAGLPGGDGPPEPGSGGVNAQPRKARP